MRKLIVILLFALMFVYLSPYIMLIGRILSREEN